MLNCYSGVLSRRPGEHPRNFVQAALPLSVPGCHFHPTARYLGHFFCLCSPFVPSYRGKVDGFQLYTKNM